MSDDEKERKADPLGYWLFRYLLIAVGLYTIAKDPLNPNDWVVGVPLTLGPLISIREVRLAISRKVNKVYQENISGSNVNINEAGTVILNPVSPHVQALPSASQQERLYLDVWNPLSLWSKTMAEALDGCDAEEVWSPLGTPWQDVSKQGIYALVLPRMRGKIDSMRENYLNFEKLRETVRSEYRNRIYESVKTLFPDSDIYQIRLDIKKGSQSFSALVYDFAPSYWLKTVRDWAGYSSATLRDTTAGGKSIDCPRSLYEKLEHTNNLPSYSKFLTARNALRIELTSFIEELESSVRNGQKDQTALNRKVAA